MDSQIFLSIPALAILYNLKEIVSRFAPSLNISNLSQDIYQSEQLAQIEEEILQLTN